MYTLSSGRGTVMNRADYEKIVNNRLIREAFEKVCEKKLMNEGYVDMSYYIDRVDSREKMRHELKMEGTLLDMLYAPHMASIDEADRYFSALENSIEYSAGMTGRDAMGIVYWVYSLMHTQKERERFTAGYFVGENKDISYFGSIGYKEGVLYFMDRVEVKFIYYLSDLDKYISYFRTPNTYYRGHADCNFRLMPSVMRSHQLEMFEEDLYYDLLVECPDEFAECSLHFDKLVKMQHYGLPTRLLDITRNPLVALYFACAEMPEKTGEIIVLNSSRETLRQHNSDTISVLASLAPLRWKDKQQLARLAAEGDGEKFRNAPVMRQLVQEIRGEKTYFQNKIQPEGVLGTYIVKAEKNNERIVRQNGAFILCGLDKELQGRNINDLRGGIGDKKLILLIKRKTKKYILETLDRLAVNYSALFPEIDCVSKYLTEKYSNIFLMIDEYLEKLEDASNLDDE